MDELLGAHVQAARGVDGDQGLGSARQFARQDHLLDVAAGERTGRGGGGGAADVIAFPEFGRVAVGALQLQEGAGREFGRGEILQREVFLYRERGNDALGVAVFGDVAHARIDDAARRKPRQFQVAQQDRTRLGHAQARQGIRQFALPVAGHAGQPQDLAAPHLEAGAVQGVVAAVGTDPEVGDGQQRLAAAFGALVVGQHHLVAGHQRRKVRGTVVGRIAGKHQLAVAQYGNLVRQGLHFGQLVADEDDGHILRHAGQQGDEFVGFLRGERGGGLVQDEEAGAEAERLDQFDALLLADGELPDVGVGLHREAVALGHFADAPAGALDIQAQGLPQVLGTQGHVFRHGHVRHEHEMLVHHADSRGIGVVRGAEPHRRAVDEQAAFVRLVQAHQDVHQGGLARAVFAHERQDLVLSYAERDAVAGGDARKPFRDAFNAQFVDRGNARSHRDLSECGAFVKIAQKGPDPPAFGEPGPDRRRVSTSRPSS